MTIEILAFDTATLFGENGHQLILQHIFVDHTIIKTSLTQEPYFVNHPVDVIYLGGMSESHLIKLNQSLMKHRQRISDLIEQGVLFLVFDNGLNIFGTSIDFEDFGVVETLGLFNFKTVQKYQPRLNNYILGRSQDFKFVAHKSQFTQSYPDPKFNDFFFEVEKGFGMNGTCRYEGVHYKNFYGTNCIGPFLVLNPLFMKSVFSKLNADLPMPKGFDTMVNAYELRLKEYESGYYEQITEVIP